MNSNKFSKVNASKIIEDLQGLIDKHGDIPVLVLSPGGYISEDVSAEIVKDDSIVGHDYILIQG